MKRRAVCRKCASNSSEIGKSPVKHLGDHKRNMRKTWGSMTGDVTEPYQETPRSLDLLFPELAVWKGDKNTIVRPSSFAILILNREMIIRGTSSFVSNDCFLGNLKEQYVVTKSYPLK